jgi:hypothetical protein
MAILTEEERQKLCGDYQGASSNIWELLGVTKAQMRAAVDATDDWIEANQASFNSALPLPARTALTSKQKVRLFLSVAQMRFNVEV